ncbi:MAG: ribonuclease HI [Alphaproteobacteria bacterium]|nr:ribonuclease HI [Alphaproteobacteria bacterium SS10]
MASPPLRLAKVSVEIFTDGACSGNPGPGGWGVLLRKGDVEKELLGGDPQTTNNRMELMAAIEGLTALTRNGVSVDLYTDSQYVQKGMNEWRHGWKRNGWKKKGKPIPNADLWERLDALDAKHDVRWHWVRGHSGHEENERVDQLAVTGAQEAKRADEPFMREVD